MAYSLYDAAVTPCAQQLGALAGIIDKAGAHCVTNKIEESALLQDRLYPDMFCLARQIRQAADFAMNTGGRLAGVTPPALPAGRTARKAGLPRPGQLALGRLEIDHSCDRKRARVEELMIIRYLSLVAAARRGDQSQGA